MNDLNAALERGGVLRIVLRNAVPVELFDLTRALAALGDEYRRDAAAGDGQVKLIVKEIRSGSIEIDLVDLGVAALAVAPLAMENLNRVAEFCRNLKAGLDWLLGRGDTRPPAMGERARLLNYRSILEPVAKDRAAQLVIAPVIENASAPVSIVVLSVDANAAQNAVARALEELREPVSGLKEKVLLRWFQARNDPAGGAGDRAIVESICPRPVKTIFLGESLKIRMLTMEENFFRRAFLVDLVVDTIEDRPALYKIIAIHDTVEIPD